MVAAANLRGWEISFPLPSERPTESLQAAWGLSPGTQAGLSHLLRLVPPLCHQVQPRDYPAPWGLQGWWKCLSLGPWCPAPGSLDCHVQSTSGGAQLKASTPGEAPPLVTSHAVSPACLWDTSEERASPSIYWSAASRVTGQWDQGDWLVPVFGKTFSFQGQLPMSWGFARTPRTCTGGLTGQT